MTAAAQSSTANYQLPITKRIALYWSLTKPLQSGLLLATGDRKSVV